MFEQWYREVFLVWPLALQWLAYVAVGLNAVIAMWLFYDAQRYDGRLNPGAWAIGALCTSCLALGLYWWRTGSARAALAFGITGVTALLLVAMYDSPIQRAVDLQIGHTMSAFPVPGMGAGETGSGI